MPLYHGSTAIGQVYHGSTEIDEIYHGSTLVYSASKRIKIIRQSTSGSSSNQKSIVQDTGIKVKNYKNNALNINNSKQGTYVIDGKLYTINNGSMQRISSYSDWTDTNIRNNTLYSVDLTNLTATVSNSSKSWKNREGYVGITNDGKVWYYNSDSSAWVDTGKTGGLYGCYYGNISSLAITSAVVTSNGIYNYSSSGWNTVTTLGGWSKDIGTNYKVFLRNGVPYASSDSFGAISGLTNIKKISSLRSGGYTGLALSTNGTLYSWTGSTVSTIATDVSDAAFPQYGFSKLTVSSKGTNNAQGYFIKNNKLFAICYDDSQSNPYTYQVDNNNYTQFIGHSGDSQNISASETVKYKEGTLII